VHVFAQTPSLPTTSAGRFQPTLREGSHLTAMMAAQSLLCLLSRVNIPSSNRRKRSKSGQASECICEVGKIISMHLASLRGGITKHAFSSSSSSALSQEKYLESIGRNGIRVPRRHLIVFVAALAHHLSNVSGRAEAADPTLKVACCVPPPRQPSSTLVLDVGTGG